MEQINKGIKTIQAGAWKGRATIPAVEGVQEKKPRDSVTGLDFSSGDTVGRFTLTAHLCNGERSRLFLAETRRQDRVVVKIYEPGAASTRPALRKLDDVVKRTGCASLMPLLSYGDLENGIHYEVMPVYQEGTLADHRLSEEEIRSHILPQLNEALRVLGDYHLVHNDIKPANIFWRDRSKWQIVLGDYDCVTFDKEEVMGGTLAYMAPERLFTGGRQHTSSSDYCSLGLTLFTLIMGQELFYEEGLQRTDDVEKLRQSLYRRWQGTVECPPTAKISYKIRGLIDRMIQQKSENRCGADYISSWLANDGLAVASYQKKTQKKQIKGLRYKGNLILDIPELTGALGKDWKFGTYMLKQHQLDDFVRQFDAGWYKLSQKCASLSDTSAGLFRLMQTIRPSRDFYWLGEHYESIEDFADRAEAKEEYGVRDPFSHFCRAELLSFYEEINGADEDQIARAKEIEKTGRKTPELAVRQLQLSMKKKPEFTFKGVTLAGLPDLLALLEENTDRLDEYVRDFYESPAASVWLDYIGQGSFLSEIKKKMLNLQEIKI